MIKSALIILAIAMAVAEFAQSAGQERFFSFVVVLNLNYTSSRK